MEAPAFYRLSAGSFDGFITRPTERVVQLVVMAATIGEVFKDVKGVIWERLMTRLHKRKGGGE
jgi:hypothetical protein